MARIFAVLSAAGRVTWRDIRSLASIAGNNFAFFLALVAFQSPSSSAFFALLLALLLLIPLTASPAGNVPADRWGLWPLSKRERVIIQAGSAVWSPVTWIVASLLIRTGWRAALWFLAAAAIARALAVAASAASRLLAGRNLTPRMPAGQTWLGGIVLLQLREMWTTLDPWVAFLLALSAWGYRWFSTAPDPAAFRVMSLVVVIALSTWAQVLFGMDGSGVVRFRLAPVRGWQLLLGKNLAYLAVVIPLIAVLDLAGGLTAALIALAVGHHASVNLTIPQTRWRFTSGAASTGIVQMVAFTAVAAAEWQNGPLVLAGAAAIWMASLFFYGRRWDRQATS